MFLYFASFENMLNKKYEFGHIKLFFFSVNTAHHQFNHTNEKNFVVVNIQCNAFDHVMKERKMYAPSGGGGRGVDETTKIRTKFMEMIQKYRVKIVEKS